ncbi:unnamed protein product [Microthlaspi erraticum]|uniref:Uncharacterized protein n=1 Tax=Microthlaspi erraticum TaxID=1685480 RepID=A0A6D2HV97_9BRAS|nr:unnamed protein product [Microthlaspi erraticum]
MQVARVCRRTDCLFSGGAEASFNQCGEAELRRNSGVKQFAFLSSSGAVLRAAAWRCGGGRFRSRGLAVLAVLLFSEIHFKFLVHFTVVYFGYWLRSSSPDLNPSEERGWDQVACRL